MGVLPSALLEEDDDVIDLLYELAVERAKGD